MTVGTYYLKLKQLGKTICITVHRGSQWETDNFILKKNCLFESRIVSKPIKVSSIQGINFWYLFIFDYIVEEIKDKTEKNVKI